MAEMPPHEQLGYMARHIRKRPCMFIGETGIRGLHCLADELIEYSLAEISAGHGHRIWVRLNLDGSLSVSDDGRGISVDTRPGASMSLLEWVMTVSTRAEVCDGERIFQTSLHGIGARAVTALSDWAQAEVCCQGRVYRQRYERGLSIGDVCDTGAAGARVGTKITFHPDAEILEVVTFDRARLRARVREVAHRHAGITTALLDEATGFEETFSSSA